MTPDQKLDAWQSVVHGSALPPTGLDAEESAEWAMRYADRVQEGREQREREGRFGPVEAEDHDPVATEAARRMEAKRADDLQANRDEWMERAQRAEKALAEAATRSDKNATAAYDRGAADGRRKAESLLKEALGQLTQVVGYCNTLPGSGTGDFWRRLNCAHKFLIRASQEGFQR